MIPIRTFSVFLVVLGLIWLLDVTGLVFNAWNIYWPVLFIVVGLCKIWNSFNYD